MDDGLRNALWTSFHDAYVVTEVSTMTGTGATHAALYRLLWVEFFKLPIDKLPAFTRWAQTEIRNWFFKASWSDVYDFIEFVGQYGRSYLHDHFLKTVNYFLQREMAGYRLVNGLITPITSERELASVEEAVAASGQAGLDGAATHIRRALALLSDRKNPDFRNSIKESISAVESIARSLAKDDKAELGKALKALGAKVSLHGALTSAFSSMYGYSSDEQGIRHAMLDKSDLDVEDAVFMLVACSAFVNYLLAKSVKAEIDVRSSVV